jgi:hypothetical protein
MLKFQAALFSFISICFFSCIGRQAYYVSPFNGITSPYHSIPMRADSIKSASYLNATISLGGANEGGTDSRFSFTTDVSRSHNFGIMQGYYGAGLTLGSYKLKPYDSVGNSGTVNYTLINQHAGTYFFGGGGFDGGINFVTGSEDFEWRIFGVETSLRQEFGRYAQVRNEIPDSAATLIVRNKFFGTAGVFTEFIGKGRHTETGCKLGWGTVLGNDYHNFNFKDSYFANNPPHFNYFTLNLHITNNKVTSYIQTNFARKASAFFLGMNYRISK